MGAGHLQRRTALKVCRRDGNALVCGYLRDPMPVEWWDAPARPFPGSVDDGQLQRASQRRWAAKGLDDVTVRQHIGRICQCALRLKGIMPLDVKYMDGHYANHA